jgi:hypothetical protein
MQENGFVGMNSASEQLATIVDELAFGSGIDSTAIQVGAEFSVPTMKEGSIPILPRVDEDILSIIRETDQSAAEYIEDMSDNGMNAETLKQRQSVINRAMKDSEFGDRIIKEYNSGSKNSFFSKLFGRSAGRDDAVRLAYRNALPKIGYGALAVGVLGAGYYINEKRKENNLYDETVEQQPYEKTGFVSQQNDGFVQINSPISSRRDPLTTAGVVGTLDRNKVGHTQMGPNKYNHLYGR